MECTHRFQNLLHQVELSNYNFVDFEEFNLMLNDLSGMPPNFWWLKDRRESVKTANMSIQDAADAEVVVMVAGAAEVEEMAVAADAGCE